MWRRPSWVVNKHFLNLIVNSFILAHKCIVSKQISHHVISLHPYLIFLFICPIFFPSSIPFLCDTTYDSTCIISRSYYFCNIILWCAHISCTTYSTCFILPSYNLYSCYHIYHSFITFLWFDVRMMPSHILYFRFDWTAHSFYHTWQIACPKLFWSITYQCRHLIHIQFFKWCSHIL